MNKEEILEFLDNFMLVRSGHHTVPDFVLEKTIEEYIDKKSLAPLLEYETLLFFSWDIGKQYSHSLEDLSKVKELIDDKGYWLSASLFSKDEYEELLTYYYTELSREKNELSYESRRKKSNRAISSKPLRDRVFARDGYKCNHCHTTENLSVDHIVPVLSGGNDNIENLQTLCTPCNSSKGAKK